MSTSTYPDDLLYTKDHEWARVEDRDGQRFVTVGITRFAVDHLGDVTQVDLPKEGDMDELGQLMGADAYAVLLREQAE